MKCLHIKGIASLHRQSLIILVFLTAVCCETLTGLLAEGLLSLPLLPTNVPCFRLTPHRGKGEIGENKQAVGLELVWDSREEMRTPGMVTRKQMALLR